MELTMSPDEPMRIGADEARAIDAAFGEATKAEDRDRRPPPTPEEIAAYQKFLVETRGMTVATPGEPYETKKRPLAVDEFGNDVTANTQVRSYADKVVADFDAGAAVAAYKAHILATVRHWAAVVFSLLVSFLSGIPMGLAIQGAKTEAVKFVDREVIKEVPVIKTVEKIVDRPYRVEVPVPCKPFGSVCPKCGTNHWAYPPATGTTGQVGALKK